MSDVLRIFLIMACMYLSFRLGEESAGRKAYKALMEGIQEATKEMNERLKKKQDAPDANETLE